jgi:hypothetical protein
VRTTHDIVPVEAHPRLDPAKRRSVLQDDDIVGAPVFSVLAWPSVCYHLVPQVVGEAA